MKKDILISVYDMEIGGIERSLVNMLESFDYDSYNIDLLIFNHSGEFLSLIPDQVNVLPQIKQYSFFRKPIVECVKEKQYSTAFVRLASKYIANAKSKFLKLEEGSGYIQMQLSLKYSTYFLPKQSKLYDIAISYAWPHDILAYKVNAKMKIAWIHTDYGKLEIDNKLDLNVWNKFDYIASISDEVTESFLHTYPSLKYKVFQMENINSPEFIKKMASEEVYYKHDSESFNLLSVGRLSYVKGFDIAIKALRNLHEQGYQNIKWFVIGYGGYETELRKLIEEYQLKESFILLGKKTNPYPYMKNCDLYVQPSRYEGKAVTVTEAKILGKPVLITNYPTARSQVQDGIDGLICDLSIEGLSRGIKRLMLENELRSNLIDGTAKKNYSNQDELIKLYKVFGS
ncbi:glycosyltransferase [Pseudalkalibacillus caeni]|uniref:Glycosyltransferase n=1 Tax=Exobacillus caeni TaxID=2574798 RepID=A0A5R9F4N0_9BACL|nr:glycosyltransferase [Pseudalkalibacillus caeni]TLS35773.1 glycosyltransferase [Pseudalkalibacillus caeni]